MTSEISVEVVGSPNISVEVTGAGAPGISAYQIAVAQGFSGDEDAWLASLKGGDGAPGPTAVSTDEGNTATLGSDDLIYVPASSGASNWGDLGGTLSDQTDLQNALDAKADTSSLGTAAAADSTDFATAAQGGKADTASQPGHTHVVDDITDFPVLPTFGTAASSDSDDFATAAQGGLADTAVQPGDLAAVATSGAYSDLSGTPSLASVATSGQYDDLTGAPTLGTAAAASTTDFATAAQGAKADTALQDYAVSTDAGNLLKLGSDDLIMLDPDDIPGGGGGGGGAYEVRHDSDSTYSYMGTAADSTAESATGWTVTRITLASPPVIETGTGVWDDRAALSYS